MPIKSIVIDNKQTTAKRIAPDKVQLDLVALPLDENSDAEPNLDIRLYVNGQLLQNLQSGADGVIKGNIVIDSSDAEQLTIALEEVTQGVKSKIKCVMISGGEEFEPKVEKPESPESDQKIEESKPDRKPEILDFVTKNGWNLSDEKCKDYINDLDVVTAAVKQNGLVLQFVSENLKNNFDVVMEAVRQNGLTLQFASDNLKNVFDIVMEAVRQNGLSLEFVSDYLKNNHDIVTTAIKQNGLVLQFASNNLKKDSNVVMEAVKQNGLSIEFASASVIQNTLGVSVEAIKQNISATFLLPPNVVLNEVVLETIFELSLENKDILESLSKKESFIPVIPHTKVYIDLNGKYLFDYYKTSHTEWRGGYFPKYCFFKTNKKIILHIMQNDPTADSYSALGLIIGDNLKRDKEFMKELKNLIK